VLEEVLVRAGFVQIEVHLVDSPFKDGICSRIQAIRALYQQMTSLTESERRDVWREIKNDLQSFDGVAGFEGPCVLLVNVGTKP